MKKILIKLAIVGAVFTIFFVDAVRVKSPGVAQTELDRMIQNAEKYPYSETQIKQLLNDISPSLRQDYQEMISQVRSKKIVPVKERADEINVVDQKIQAFYTFINSEDFEKNVEKTIDTLLEDNFLGKEESKKLKKIFEEMVEKAKSNKSDAIKEEKDEEESKDMPKENIKDTDKKGIDTEKNDTEIEENRSLIVLNDSDNKIEVGLYSLEDNNAKFKLKSKVFTIAPNKEISIPLTKSANYWLLKKDTSLEKVSVKLPKKEINISNPMFNSSRITFEAQLIEEGGFFQWSKYFIIEQKEDKNTINIYNLSGLITKNKFKQLYVSSVGKNLSYSFDNDIYKALE